MTGHADDINDGMASFRLRLKGGTRLVGIFLKCFHPTIVETVARTDVDFVVFDLEHAPASADMLNVAILAARAWGRACLIRLPDFATAGIQQAVALGADGIFVPHVNSAAEVAASVEFGRQLAAERAVAGFGRAAGFETSPAPDAVAEIRDRFAVILQVDEPPGIDAVDEIAQLDCDALFVGRFGLALRHGSYAAGSDVVSRSVQSVADAAIEHKRRFGMYLPEPEELRRWSEAGATLFVIGTDLGFLTTAARSAIAAAREKF